MAEQGMSWVLLKQAVFCQVKDSYKDSSHQYPSWAVEGVTQRSHKGVHLCSVWEWIQNAFVALKRPFVYSQSCSFCTYLEGAKSWSRRWFIQGEGQLLHSICEATKCWNLNCIISWIWGCSHLRCMPGEIEKGRPPQFSPLLVHFFLGEGLDSIYSILNYNKSMANHIHIPVLSWAVHILLLSDVVLVPDPDTHLLLWIISPSRSVWFILMPFLKLSALCPHGYPFK